jgi:hypothetical protein
MTVRLISIWIFDLCIRNPSQRGIQMWYNDKTARIWWYSALPDVYGPLYLISKAQCTRLNSWRVGKIVENGFKRMNKKIKSVFITFKFILFLLVISHLIWWSFNSFPKKSKKSDNEWKMKKKWLSGLFISALIGYSPVLICTGSNKNIHFWCFWPHTHDWKVFWCSFFSFIFISFTCHTTHFDFYLFFWKIIKDFETLSIDMKKHVNFLLMQIIFLLW